MAREFSYQRGGAVCTVQVEAAGDRYLVRVGDQLFTVTAQLGEGGRLDLEVDGRRCRAYAASDRERCHVALDGQTWTLRHPETQAQRRATAAAASGALRAAMPGRVLDVLTKAGDAVRKGETLVLLEAMKMELRIAAPADGVVTHVNAQAGQVVERDQLLVEITPGAAHLDG